MEGVFVKGFLSKYVTKFINKIVGDKIGTKPNIELSNLELTTNDKVKLNICLEMSQEDFDSMMEVILK